MEKRNVSDHQIIQNVFVSVVMPVHNEIEFIGHSLKAVLAQNYPSQRMEVIVADGMSTDGTREIVQSFSSRHTNLHLIDNPAKIAAAGLNAAIMKSHGEIIIRVDGHTEIAVDYVSRCVANLQRTGADNVGGRMAAVGTGAFSKALALAICSKFGAGSARFRYSDKEEWVDTVYLGAWRRELFVSIGLFDEELVRNQDDEFNYRILEHGGKILLSPDIRSKYVTRDNCRSLWWQYYQYGYWKVRVLQKHYRQTRLRHVVPFSFVFALLGLGAFSVFSVYGQMLLILIAGGYLLANLCSSFWIATRYGWRQFPLLPVVFGILHLSYGLGFLKGLTKFAKRWKDRAGKVPKLNATTSDSIVLDWLHREYAERKSKLADWEILTAKIPHATIIMAVHNEASYISRTLRSVIEQEYPRDRLEIIVADGLSTDRTREIVRSFQTNNPNINLVDNPGRIVATGLNAAIRQAKGEIIIRVDGHCEIAPDYVWHCVQQLQQNDADAVGGPTETIGESFLAQVIAIAMSTFFGVGDSAFRTVKNRKMLVDTVAFPAYKRETIEKAGLFDEELVRDQDDEYNYRLRRLGGKILLSPDIRSRYYSRSSLNALFHQYFQYGYWKVRVLQKHTRYMRLRQFVPSAFLVALLGSVVLSFLVPFGQKLLALVIGGYLLSNLTSSVWNAKRHGWGYLLLLPITYATLHLSYGFGFLLGLIKFANRVRDKKGMVPTI